jgi:GxxExxY protein
MLTSLPAVLDSSRLALADRSLDALHERIIGTIVGAFYAVHRELGFGFIESVYYKALAVELSQRGLNFDHQVPVAVYYKGRKIGHFRADLCVESKVVVEVRSAPSIHDADRAQLLNHLRSSNVPLGLLLHFGYEAQFERIDGVTPAQ